MEIIGRDVINQGDPRWWKPNVRYSHMSKQEKILINKKNCLQIKLSIINLLRLILINSLPDLKLLYINRL